LRYIYHALIILTYYKKTSCKNIVEVGCGYGGLCLAINYFSKILDVTIQNYNIIDLKSVCKLISSYLELHTDTVGTTINYHESTTYGENIHNNELFFISNYCYTEIDIKHNKKYTELLLSKTTNGFLVWQNGGNNCSYPIENASTILHKEIKQIEEERPQTDQGIGKFCNFFLYF
jgi:uncharacterized protein YkvS